jgi:LuxR family maltose regulon positive regulatory protein
MTSLVPTKFYLPPVPAGFVARPQLFDRLDEALRHRLTLVSAQAGAGKTTLVSAWVQARRSQGAIFGWLSLDEADNVPSRFTEYMIASLEEGGAHLSSITLAIDSAGQAFEDFGLKGFIRETMDLEQELVLILDDYHLIDNQDIHAAIAYLIEHIPPRLHLILLTRSDPPLELARLRVADQLVEVRMEHLRFSQQETAAFVKKAAGMQLDEADASALNARTEGWVAGLQMAAISMQGRQDISSFIAAFAGSHRFVFDYMLEQVLNRQSPEMRQFLLKTSVLEQLSAPLCDAVAETGGHAWNLLDSLERANLFLAPLDDERSWYRYHHLFADLLKLVLEQTYPSLAAELHCKACRWYEAQGMIPQALNHALAAGDMELTAHLVSANVLALVERAELAPILLRMDAIMGKGGDKPSGGDGFSWLCVAHAWALAYTGQMERSGIALTLAEKCMDQPPADECERIAGHVAAVRAYTAWVAGDQQVAVDAAEVADRLLTGEEAGVRALNLTTLGNALTQYQASPRAVQVLEQAVTLARQSKQSHVLMLAASALAYAYAVLGSLRKAQAVCLEAIDVADAYQQKTRQQLSAAASVYAILAGILSKRGEIQQSIQASRKGLALSELWGQADTVMVCLLHLADGLSLGNDFEAAQQTIQRARKLANQVSPWFVVNVEQIEMRILLNANDTNQATRLAREATMPLPPSLQARLLLKQGRLDEALSLLECALPEALNTPSLESVYQFTVQAMAYSLKNDEVQALRALKRALELAEPEGLVECFVRDEQVMERLLQRALAKGLSSKFTRQLLASFQDREKVEVNLKDELYVEALSERELEVLHLLSSHLSVPEIAGELYISANTVRTHIKNIYGKLGVHRRSLAVHRAHELGLLA